MYRIDGIFDRISNRTAEADNALNDYREAKARLQEESLLILFKDFAKKETQEKIDRLINNPAFTEISVIFRIIDKQMPQERLKQSKGIASHLLAILLHNLSHSKELWNKLILIIGNNSEASVDDFNKLLKRQSILNRIIDVMGDYLKCLCQIGDEFFIDTEAATEKKIELYKSIEVSQMVLVIHHLLNQPHTSTFTHNKVFCTFELSPSFINYLRLMLRNLSL